MFQQVLLRITAVWICTLPSFSTPENNPTIQIALNDWTSQIVLSKITGELLKKMDYKVAYTWSSTEEQWGALARGLVHVQMEVWEGTMADQFGQMVAQKHLVDVGTYTATTREEWWYPLYVEELCPGLPNWEALKHCSEIFVVPQTAPKGRYISGPWEKPDDARIRALGLNFQVVRVAKGDDLWVALKQASEARQPILIFNWSPNWVEAVYEGRFVNFPEYERACETDPKWGINEKYLYDCGNPRSGWLKKAVWSKMEQTWPCAYQLIKRIDLDNKGFAEIAALVDVQGLSYDAAAEHWLNHHEALWRSWIPSGCSAQ